MFEDINRVDRKSQPNGYKPEHLASYIALIWYSQMQMKKSKPIRHHKDKKRVRYHNSKGFSAKDGGVYGWGKKNRPPKHTNRFSGAISVNSRGVGYFPIEGYAEDIEIENHFLKTAMNSDEVVIVLLPKSKFERQKGEVVKIVKRAKMRFVGTVKKNGGFFVEPDDKKMYRDIFVSPQKTHDANEGDKVLVKIKEWTDYKKNPEGEVLQIIGRRGEHNAEMESIVLESGFDINFPKEVDKEADTVASRERARMEEEAKNRRDFRNITTFTIDPYDAKDFDDALSLKELGNNEYEVGVHIADVSHYVTENSELDREARKRGLSVYLVDRTIPMLPEVLSNDVCSLNPNEDRLSMSAVFILDKNARIKHRWFGKTIINSNKRFSYEDAQKVLDEKKGQYFKELNILNNLAKILQGEKFKNGAIDFETEEVKFRLDEKGVPIEVFRKTRLDTHKLIEEFMLLANKEVAEHVFKANKAKKAAFIYRIHDIPNPEKIIDLGIFLKAFGFDLNSKDGVVHSKEINALLKKVEGSPQESLIKTAAIRSMAKAIYSTRNIGHFGLGFEYYTHFTSPIRRYPDLIVHRLLQRELTKGKIQPDEFARYERISAESSKREIEAAEAERASIKYKQVEYMSKHIGHSFEGTISGVAEWGIYVEEANTKCEGMVRLRDLADDYYVLDKKNYAIIGQKTRRKYSLGDKVKFKVVSADLERKTLDYVFV